MFVDAEAPDRVTQLHPGHCDDVAAGERRICFDGARHLEPVDVRHPYVADHNVGEKRKSDVDAGLSIQSRLDVMAGALQEHGQRLDGVGVVVDDENAPGAPRVIARDRHKDSIAEPRRSCST